MTRTDLSAAMAAVATSARIRPFLTFEADLDSGGLYFWTGIGPLVWNSTSYTGSADVIQIEPAEETQELRNNGIRVVLSGIDASILAVVLGEPWQGRPMRVRLGGLDSADDPASVVIDPVLMFSGFLDQMNWTEDGDTATIVVTGESRTQRLEIPNIFRYTAEEQRRRHPGDTFFDFTAELVRREITLKTR